MTAVRTEEPRGARPDPLSREALFRQVGALVGAVLLGFLSMAVREMEGQRAGLLVQASTVTAAIAMASLAVPWHRLPYALHALMPFVLLAVAHLAREATGGAESVYGQLALLPIFWVAVYGTWAELGGIVVAAGALLAAPLIGEGGTGQQWMGNGAVLVGGSVVALFIHRFFVRIRHENDRLQVFAGTDSLTGAANRRAWDEELSAALLRAVREGLPLSVSLLDLDDFKEYNDRHGHQAGDRVLKEAAAAWRGILRASDMLARVGGDEFAVLLPGCPLDKAATISDRLRAAVPAAVRCSVGVAVWDGRESAQEFLARADRALYDAKDRGRNRVVIVPDGARVELRAELGEERP